jgi:hypothetical protein
LISPSTVSEGAAHRLAGQVFTDLDAETIALEFVGHVTGVVDRFLQRRLGIRVFGVTDHQRKPVASRGERGGNLGDTKNQGQKQ